MDLKVLLCVTWAATLAAGTSAQNSQCGQDEFWNSDIGRCMLCSVCKKYPKTPSCETCPLTKDSPDVWKVVAITSFSTLVIVVFASVLLVGILVHRYRSRRKSTLREPVEETTGPLYQI